MRSTAASASPRFSSSRACAACSLAFERWVHRQSFAAQFSEGRANSSDTTAGPIATPNAKASNARAKTALREALFLWAGFRLIAVAYTGLVVVTVMITAAVAVVV